MHTKNTLSLHLHYTAVLFCKLESCNAFLTSRPLRPSSSCYLNCVVAVSIIGDTCSIDSRTMGRYSIGRTKALDYLLCRGDDEISTLAREFSDMITGLGRRGSAAEAKSLADGSVYPDNPFTTDFVRPPPPPPTVPPSAPTEEQ